MNRKLTRAALLLAIMIVLQSLRLWLPLPSYLSLFVIGSAVNACFLIAVEMAGWRLALALACIAPVIAYFQQVLPLPLFILPVAIANSAYLLGYASLRQIHRGLAIATAVLVKMLSMYLSISWILTLVYLPEKLASLLRLMLSWPQLITGVLGGVVCLMLMRRLFRANIIEVR